LDKWLLTEEKGCPAISGFGGRLITIDRKKGLLRNVPQRDLDIGRRIAFKRILKKYVVRVGNRFVWRRIWSSGGFCEHNKEL
jgi:hypothetical protein